MNFGKLLKSLNVTHIIVIVAALALLYALYNYSQNKGAVMDSMDNNHMASPVVSDLAPNDESESGHAAINANGVSSNTLPPAVGGVPVVDPAELLPRDENSEWASLNPMGSGDLQNVNLLQAGHHIGINTVSSSLRNANLQLRSEPANPQMAVGPWNQSTIEPDANRRPLEIGSSA